MSLYIIIFGPQGSGKGTQAKKLAQRYDLEHISTGSMFRQEIVAETPLGKELKESIGEGILASDDLTNRIIDQKIHTLIEQEKGFVLDGYPRTINQAKFLDNTDIDIDHVILLDISDEESIERLQNRFRTAALNERREDDSSEDSIRQRLELYHEYTRPLINFYEDKGLLRHINGSLSIDEVTTSIISIIEPND